MLSMFVLSWALTIGIVPEQTEIVDYKKAELNRSRVATVATLSLGVTAWERIYMYTNLETYQYKSNAGFYFIPYRTDYIFGMDFYVNKNITIGLEHECDHPVVSYTNMKADYKYMSSETKLFIRIGSER